MNNLILAKRELKTVIQETVKEVLAHELVGLRALLVPFVSRAEQKDIEQRYGVPSRKAAKGIEMQL